MFSVAPSIQFRAIQTLLIKALVLKELEAHIFLESGDLRERNKIDMSKNAFRISLRDTHLFNPGGY